MVLVVVVRIVTCLSQERAEGGTHRMGVLQKSWWWGQSRWGRRFPPSRKRGRRAEGKQWAKTAELSLQSTCQWDELALQWERISTTSFTEGLKLTLTCFSKEKNNQTYFVPRLPQSQCRSGTVTQSWMNSLLRNDNGIEMSENFSLRTHIVLKMPHPPNTKYSSKDNFYRKFMHFLADNLQNM